MDDRFFTFYNKQDGSIVGQFYGTRNEADLNAGEYGVVPGHYDREKYYVYDGEVFERMIMKLAVRDRKVTGLPNPTLVQIKQGPFIFSQYTVTDGTIEFSSNEPGPHTLTLSSPKYRTTEVIIK